MSISSTASASVHSGFEMVNVKGYRLQTTMEIGEMDWACKSCSSDGMDRARIPRCFGSENLQKIEQRLAYHRAQRDAESSLCRRASLVL